MVMTTNKTWTMVATVAVVGAVAFFSGRATAEDKQEGMPPPQAKIGTHPLVKGLTGTWNVAGKGLQGDHTGTSSYALACGDTVVVNHYASKTGSTEFYGLGVGKLSDDGKSATLWWFDNYMPGVLVFTGPATDAGYELTVKDGEMAGAKAKMTKKGEGWTFVLSSGADEFVNETYTRAK
jgi:hypothetical protein